MATLSPLNHNDVIHVIHLDVVLNSIFSRPY